MAREPFSASCRAIIRAAVLPTDPPRAELNALRYPSALTGFPEQACGALTEPAKSGLGPVSRGSEFSVPGGVQAMLTHLTCQGSYRRVEGGLALVTD